MTEVLVYRAPRKRFDHTADLGMYIFLGSWAMLFAGLFFAYGAVRSHARIWPPPGVPSLPVLLPALNTVVLLASSATLHWWLSLTERRRQAGLPASLTVGLGAAFGALQVVLWRGIYASGLRPDTGPYPSVFWALTVFHALHVLIGLCALAALAVRALRPRDSSANPMALRLWAKYWHFVDLIWVVVFVAVFF